jgi:hypothetical protein
VRWWFAWVTRLLAGGPWAFVDPWLLLFLVLFLTRFHWYPIARTSAIRLWAYASACYGTVTPWIAQSVVAFVRL